MTDGELRGWLTAVVVLLILNFARAFFPAYLGKKGQNLADKEDIAHITREIEGVKSGYTMVTEQFKAQHQLRLAAVERRLEAHQEAYALWSKLMNGSLTEHWGALIAECQHWWASNCLYLEPDAREAFSDAYFHASLVLAQMKGGGPIPATAGDWSKISGAGERLARAVALPGLTSAEGRAVAQSVPGAPQ